MCTETLKHQRSSLLDTWVKDVAYSDAYSISVCDRPYCLYQVPDKCLRCTEITYNLHHFLHGSTVLLL